MRDKLHGQAEAGAQVLQQRQDLCFNGNIQRRYRFIRDQQLRLHRQGACDTNALALVVGKFVREAFRGAGVKLYKSQEFGGGLTGLLARDAMGDRTIGDDVACATTRI